MNWSMSDASADDNAVDTVINNDEGATSLFDDDVIIVPQEESTITELADAEELQGAQTPTTNLNRSEESKIQVKAADTYSQVLRNNCKLINHDYKTRNYQP